MAKRIINLRYAGRCADCGAALEVGAPARYYGRGKVYGTGCHTRGGERVSVTPDGDYGGACEDYPCCGHGQGMCGSERRAERRADERRLAKSRATVAHLPAPVPGLCPDVDAPVDFQRELLDPFGVDR